MVINSKSNQRIVNTAKLKQKKYRDEQCLYLIEGFKMLDEAKLHNIEVVESFVVEDKFDLIKNQKNVSIVTNSVLDYLSDTVTPQGVVSIVKKPVPVFHENKNVLILDGISDPGNLGTLIRSACAFDYLNIYLINSADPYSGKVVRSTMSGIYEVSLFEADSYENVFNEIKQKGYTIYAADMGGEDVELINNNNKVALIIGSEAHGINKEVYNFVDKTIKIPMKNNIESLNAAVSGSILMLKLN